VGDTVIALGAGRGNEGWTDIGVVQERNWVGSYASGAVSVPGLIATGTRTTPATAGGGLFDPNGRIIGILATMPGGTRDGLAVPIDVVLDVTSQLERNQQALHGAIGVVFGVDATGESPGATVSALVPDGPATRGDDMLQPGDVILVVGRTRVRGWQDAIAAIRQHQPADQLELGVLRANRTVRVDVQLGPAADTVDTPWGPVG